MYIVANTAYSLENWNYLKDLLLNMNDAFVEKVECLYNSELVIKSRIVKDGRQRLIYHILNKHRVLVIGVCGLNYLKFSEGDII